MNFFYNSTVLCIVKFTGNLLSDEIRLAVREWEREGMGITNGNGIEKTFLLISSPELKLNLSRVQSPTKHIIGHIGDEFLRVK